MIGPGGWSAVLQLDGHAPRRECLGFRDLPLLDPAQISIHAAAPESAAAADRLFDAARDALANLAVPAVVPDVCGGPGGLLCQGRTDPACRSMLVLLTGPAPIDASAEALLRQWDRGGGRDRVLPIVPAGAHVGAILPAPFDRLQALEETVPIEQLVPDVLHAAGIGLRERSLFLSYRRADARDVADVLHDDFTHAGFRVFLDRFASTPGRPFPAELAEEMMDKGVVVVLETADLRRSSWTLAEIAFAFVYRLGLVAVNLDRAPRLRLIPDADRIAVHRRFGHLSAPDRTGITQFVRRAYARQTYRRRVYLQALLGGALAKHGQAAVASAGGLFPVAGNGRRYKAHLTSAPPALADAHRLCGDPDPADPVIVGAHALSAPQLRADMAWLSGRLGFAFVDEGAIVRAVDRMVAGAFPP